MKIKLVENWKQAGTWWSVKWQLALIVVAIAMAFLPVIQQHVSVTSFAIVSAVCSVLTIVFRILAQTPKSS